MFLTKARPHGGARGRAQGFLKKLSNLVYENNKEKNEENIYESLQISIAKVSHWIGPPGTHQLWGYPSGIKSQSGKVALRHSGSSDHQHWAHHINHFLPPCSPCLPLPLLIPSESWRAQLPDFCDSDFTAQPLISQEIWIMHLAFLCLNFLINK